MNVNKPGLPDYTGPNEGWAFWVHHEQMLEYCTDFKGRIAYILNEKPQHEQATRLAALTYLTPDELPSALDTAWTALDTAWTAYDTASTDYDTASTDYATAWTAYATASTAYATARTAYATAWTAAIPLLRPLCERYCAGLYKDGALRFTQEQPQ